VHIHDATVRLNPASGLFGTKERKIEKMKKHRNRMGV